ncbi:MAG TPA: YdhR family protein [Anaerolineae bacterium]|nr:YdhR family protein [Anaerolineae bacterium]
MQKHVKWLRISYWAGAVVDLLAALQMLAPQLMALTSRWENFQPGADYRFAMGMGAPLMLGWTALLLWADRDPVARKGILPITIFPVIVGSAINYGWAVRVGLVALGVVLPLWFSQTVLTGLFLTSYALNTPLKDRPLAVMFRSLGLLLSGRAHFPAAHLSDKLTREDGRAFRVFREVIVAPRKGGPDYPTAIFRVWFYAAGPTRLTRLYSWLTTLLFFGMVGFRHKVWLEDTATGEFGGIYEWETLADAEAYADSFAMRLSKLRAIPGKFSLEVFPSTDPRAEMSAAYNLSRTALPQQLPQVDDPAAPDHAPEPSGGYPVAMIRPTMEDIPHVPFPAGFHIRPLRPDEGGLWRDIQRDAEPYFPIADDLFESQFGYDPPAIPQRCYFVVDECGVAVGTISAWYNRDFKGGEWGQIHWVALRRAYQGKGLARPMLSHALTQMAQWHDRAFLGTSAQRLPAIKLYLDFGFVPDLDDPGAAEAWRTVAEELKHPALAGL